MDARAAAGTAAPLQHAGEKLADRGGVDLDRVAPHAVAAGVLREPVELVVGGHLRFAQREQRRLLQLGQAREPLTDRRDRVGKTLPLGLVDVKVCAVSEVWSGLKLVIRKELRSHRLEPRLDRNIIRT